jgi:hypothetical protein
MVDYVVFGAQAWASIVHRDALALGQGPSKESLTYFRYQVHQWQQDLDPAVRFDVASVESNRLFAASTDDEIGTYLKTLLYLRSNQIQILVLRPILIYHHTARNNLPLILEAVMVAKKSIRVLHSVATETDLYRPRQVIFNHFLSSALAVLFLAAAYDAENKKSATGSPEGPSGRVGEALMADSAELQIGLDLIDQYRMTSASAGETWTSFARPRQQLVRLGFLTNKPSNGGGEKSSTSEAIVTDEFAEFSTPFEFDQFDVDSANSLQWLDWFEGAFTDSSMPFGMPSWM